MPPTQVTEHVVDTVPTKRVLIAGIILGIFHPPVIGLVYALCFAFTPATRRVAMWVAVWTIAWMIIYSFVLGFVGTWIYNNKATNTVSPASKYLLTPALPHATTTP